MLLSYINNITILHHVVGDVAPEKVEHELQVEPPPAQGFHQPIVEAIAEALQQLDKR